MRISVDTTKLKNWIKYFNSVDTEYIGINFSAQTIIIAGDSGNILSFSNTNFSSNDEMPNKFFVFDKAEFINLFTTYNDLSILIDEDKQHSYIGDNYGKGTLKRVDALASTYLDASSLFNYSKDSVVKLLSVSPDFITKLKNAFYFVDPNSNKIGYRVAMVCQDKIVGASNNRIYLNNIEEVDTKDIDFAIDKEAFKILCDIPGLDIYYESNENEEKVIPAYFMENEEIKIYYKSPRPDRESSTSHFIRNEKAIDMMNLLRNNSFDVDYNDLEKALKFMGFYCGKVSINPNNQCLITLDLVKNTLTLDYDDQTYLISILNHTYIVEEDNSLIEFKMNVVYLLQVITKYCGPNYSKENTNITIFENSGQKPNMIMLTPIEGEEIYLPKLSKI